MSVLNIETILYSFKDILRFYSKILFSDILISITSVILFSSFIYI